MEPIFSVGLSSCCTVLSLIGVVFLCALGYAYDHDVEVLMGSIKSPHDGHVVATQCYSAAVIYAAFVAFCACQSQSLALAQDGDLLVDGGDRSSPSRAPSQPQPLALSSPDSSPSHSPIESTSQAKEEVTPTVDVGQPHVYAPAPPPPPSWYSQAISSSNAGQHALPASSPFVRGQAQSSGFSSTPSRPFVCGAYEAHHLQPAQSLPVAVGQGQAQPHVHPNATHAAYPINGFHHSPPHQQIGQSSPASASVNYSPTYAPYAGFYAATGAEVVQPVTTRPESHLRSPVGATRSESESPNEPRGHLGLPLLQQPRARAAPSNATDLEQQIERKRKFESFPVHQPSVAPANALAAQSSQFGPADAGPGAERSPKKGKTDKPAGYYSLPYRPGVTPFILKLRFVLDNPHEFESAVKWDPSGTVVLVRPGAKALAGELLPRLYNHSNPEGFGRQFGVYGFSRVQKADLVTLIPPGEDVEDYRGWEHHEFQRNSSDQTLNRLGPKKGSGVKRAEGEVPKVGRRPQSPRTTGDQPQTPVESSLLAVLNSPNNNNAHSSAVQPFGRNGDDMREGPVENAYVSGDGQLGYAALLAAENWNGEQGVHEGA